MKKNFLKNFEPIKLGDVKNSDLSGFDLSDSLGRMSGVNKNLFLKRFTADDLMKIMDKVGLIAHLKKKGFSDIIPTINVDESLVNYFKIYIKNETPDSLIFDLRLSETKFIPKKIFLENEFDLVTYDMIVIEWLSAQNPFSKFNDGRPQLPGQERPGLGILKYCFDMMYFVAKEIVKDGFLDVPDHAHGAIMYSKKFKFFDPRHEGVLRAILRDLKKYSLSDISWGMITETVYDEYKNKPHKYDPSEQIFYISERMRQYFHSKKFMKEYKKYFKIKKFRFDYDEMVKRRADILSKKSIVDL